MVCKIFPCNRFDLNGICYICLPRSTSPTCYEEKSDNSSHSKWCFVQIYDVLDEKEVIAHSVDVTLDSISSQRARNAGISYRLKSGKVYGLL